MDDGGPHDNTFCRLHKLKSQLSKNKPLGWSNNGVQPRWSKGIFKFFPQIFINPRITNTLKHMPNLSCLKYFHESMETSDDPKLIQIPMTINRHSIAVEHNYTVSEASATETEHLKLPRQ